MSGTFDAPVQARQQVLLDTPRTTLSTYAGGYFCGHVFFILAHRARLSRTPAGGVRAGFLHIPKEPDDASALPRTERFAALRQVLDTALIGASEEMSAHGIAPRLLITGFGPFFEVSDNISGALTSHEPTKAALIKAHPSLSLAFTTLPVSDRCLDDTDEASMVRAVRAHDARAVIAMGLARSRSTFTVESVPDDAGLAYDGRPVHVLGKAARQRGPVTPWLADCIRLGHRLRSVRITD